MDEVLTSPSEYTVDDSIVALTRLERFDYLPLETTSEKNDFLCAVLKDRLAHAVPEPSS
ncbi:uncharacterized protein PHACADRAFT_261473 [Phanerochaete carnosa HHB-10118-sp]|uniref:Uncharacterized protein n=1 Tax=Phanerochaete carnosa (strain HHB-10118-sp) TaxID=650164 RepID=K5VN22_PHACS|nr:uncharacterized protein PHACADRAFT_261473 [Phanerochaete carnosa HHB-10118-sp]EKM52823.1 hypothetical protein PHACADRAFT_261473 [Phanerochaete carnosa HHB-10118-sp]